MSKEKLVNGKKIMSGREFFKKWNTAKEKVNNQKVVNNINVTISEETSIPLF